MYFDWLKSVIVGYFFYGGGKVDRLVNWYIWLVSLKI